MRYTNSISAIFYCARERHQLSMTIRRVTLTAPEFTTSHVKEKITCIRAHRERVFQISHEQQGDKLIFHNYGQGGAGLTFLFGSVNESMRQFAEYVDKNHAIKSQSIHVVGAGCYGLLTAICLARAGYTVSILAQELEKTSSANAAGFFFPRSRKTSTPQEREIFHSLGMESYAIYQQIINGEHSFIKKEAAALLPVYFGLDIDPGYDLYIEQGLVAMPEKVIIDFGKDKTYEALEYKTLFINASFLIKELQRNVRELGITVIQAEVSNFNDLESPVIFNCTGIGAKKLTGDKRVIPVQGHLITLKNQTDMAPLQYMLNMKVVMQDQAGMLRDELIYYSPKQEGVLGITFIRGKRSLSANEQEFDRILKRCHDFFG